MNNLDEIRRKIDIVELISSYLPLKKTGQNFKALCPFHKEKTPSFMVSPSKQIWHCFGCNRGGDIFTFIMEMEHMDFVEALNYLAEKAGVELQKIGKKEMEEMNKAKLYKNRLLKINELAAKFYHKILTETKYGEQARAYLENRGLSTQTITNFQLGFAPKSKNLLVRFLKQKGFSEKEILDAGLAVIKDQGIYVDRFFNRIMFPIFDLQGQVVGFGGRVFSLTTDNQPFDSDQGRQPTTNVAKYINSPETPIFFKSRILYGLDRAKEAIKNENKVIVVEGYTDVISAHQAGFLNIVASLGTALTEEQLKLISRFTNNIYLAYDIDIAGDTATKRGIDLAKEIGLEVYVVTIPKGKDPDECIRENPTIFKNAIEKASSVIDYYFSTTLAQYDRNKVEEKKKIAAILLPIIKKIPDTIEQAHYIQKLATVLNISEKDVRAALDKIKSEKNKKEEISIPSGRNIDLDKYILGIILNYPTKTEKLVEKISPERMKDSELIEVYRKLKKVYNKENFDALKFISGLDRKDKNSASLASFVAEEILKNATDLEVEQEIDKLIERLDKIYYQQDKKSFEEKIAEAEKRGDRETIKELIKEFSDYIINRKKNEENQS
jgi:DNA primase